MPHVWDATRWVQNEDGSYSRRITVESAEVDATEGAEDLAAELGIDLATVEGTGKDGRITKGDVEAAAETV